jgi:hypothetical protein
MKVREEIEKYADEKDKTILLWLFERYHMESEWRIMASCEFVKDPSQKQWGAHRRWFPQGTGLALYEHAKMKKALDFYADAENWKEIETGIGMMNSPAVDDGGYIAREALK